MNDTISQPQIPMPLLLSRSWDVNDSLELMSALKQITTEPIYYIEYQTEHEQYIQIFMLYQTDHVINVDGYQDAALFSNTLRQRPSKVELKVLDSEAEFYIRNKYKPTPRTEKTDVGRWETRLKTDYRFKYILYPYTMDTITKELKDSNDDNLLSYLPDEIINNKVLMLNYLQHNGRAVQYIGKQLVNDLDIITTAITHNGLALRYLAEEHKNNKDLILKSIETSTVVFECLDPVLKKDKSFILNALDVNNSIFSHIDTSLKKDKEFCLTVIDKHTSKFVDTHIWNELDISLKIDPEIMLTALRKSPQLFKDMNILFTGKLIDEPRLLFIKDHGHEISDSDWHTVKQALLQNPTLFFNPPEALNTLLDGTQNKFLYLAQYALAQLYKPNLNLESSILSEIEL